MSIKSEPYYSVTCDWEGCAANAQDDSEFSAYRTPDAAVEDAEQSDWLTVRSADGTERYYCLEHTHWSEDEDEMLPGPVVADALKGGDDE